MTKIKLCGLTRPEDIEAANALMPDFVGFVFAEKSRRYVSPEIAARLRGRLNPEIQAAGVFVDAPPERVAELLEKGTIQIAQLHGQEDEAYIRALRGLTDRAIWKAFRITAPGDLAAAAASGADLVLLDNGPGIGRSGKRLRSLRPQTSRRPTYQAPILCCLTTAPAGQGRPLTGRCCGVFTRGPMCLRAD